MCVEVEAGAVVADRVSADGWWGVFELLGDIFDHCLAVHAQERAAHLKPQGSHNEQAVTEKLNITVFMHQSFCSAVVQLHLCCYLTLLIIFVHLW